MASPLYISLLHEGDEEEENRGRSPLLSLSLSLSRSGSTSSSLLKERRGRHDHPISLFCLLGMKRTEEGYHFFPSLAPFLSPFPPFSTGRDENGGMATCLSTSVSYEKKRTVFFLVEEIGGRIGHPSLYLLLLLLGGEDRGRISRSISLPSSLVEERRE